MDDQWNDINFDDSDLARLLDEPLQPATNHGLRTEKQHEGFDNNSGGTWIYPSNLPMRSYQKNIIQSALYRNTLVVLPTGLGKTFIAAVVMYNLYRWYPKGKVIFMAPTRPLVAQQIEACQRIMPFPAEDTVELTGKLQRAKRSELWRTKRVFFVTPQVLQSDIASAPAEFPFKHIKLLVFDEAHKAKGRYAYTEVAQSLMSQNQYFRVLALSATPGRTTEDVAEVIRNLFISHVEMRCDNSIDVVPYVHKRSIRTLVVPLGAEIQRIREELLVIIDPYVRQLIEADVLRGQPGSITRNFLLYAQKSFRERSQHQRHSDANTVSTNFSICISLYHALELLERHGLRVFLNSFEADDEGRCKFVLTMDRRLAELVERLRAEIGPNPFDVSAHAMTNGRMPEIPEDLDFGHPKFEKARKCLIEHFESNPDSRAIVFCEYRESVMLIYRLLLQHSPVLRPRCFVGQGGTTGSLRALTQKQQIQIMADFRAGKSNILIATSIGEEGIDVGEVELIVCFDISTSNPTRFVQRIGRTGRKKNGNVVMLVTEGREHQLLQDVLKHKDHTNKKLANSSVVRGALYGHSPRLVPTELNPTCVHTFMQPNEVKDAAEPPTTKEAKKKSKEKIAVKGSQDLRKFFKKSESQKHSDGGQNQPQLAHKVEDLSLNDSDSVEPVTKATDLSSHTEFEADPMYLKKINRILCSKKSLVSRPERNEDLCTQLRSPQLSGESKLLLLRLRVDFVRAIYEQMNILLALPPADVDQDVVVMSKEEQQVRDTYTLVETICGSRQVLENMLDDAEFRAYGKSINVDEDTDEVATNALRQSDVEFMSCVDAIFSKCDNLGFRCDNFDYIQTELKKTTRYQQLLEDPEESYVNQTVDHTFDDDDDISLMESMMTDSKYASQWDELTRAAERNDNVVAECNDNVVAECNDNVLAESKYASQWEEFVAGSKCNDNKSTPMHGPLERAFKRQTERQHIKSSTFLENLMEDDDDIYFIEDPALMATQKFEVNSLQPADAILENNKIEVNSIQSANAMVETLKFEVNSLQPNAMMETHKFEVNPIQPTNAMEKTLKFEVNSIEPTNDLNASLGTGDVSLNATPSLEVDSSRITSMLKSLQEALSPARSVPATKRTIEGQTTKDNDNDSTISMVNASGPENETKTSAINLEDSSKGYSLLKPDSSSIVEDSYTKLAYDDQSRLPLDPPKPNTKPSTTCAIRILERTPSPPTTPAAAPKHESTLLSSEKILRELDLDMDAFLEPFPEEQIHIAETEKENRSEKRPTIQTLTTVNSPDLFATDESPRSPRKSKNVSTLASKLAAKRLPPIMKTPEKLKPTSTASKKSPSIFDMYMMNLRRRGQMPKSPLVERSKNTNAATQNDEDDSLILGVTKRGAKRKFIDSSDDDDVCLIEEKHSLVEVSDDDSETDAEETIAATQIVKRPSKRFQHSSNNNNKNKRRRLLNSFIDQEAGVSGSESEDEAEHTIGQYLCDSVVVAESDVDTGDSDASDTDRHAIYLQSLKSPHNRPGAFKIPAPRQYNDIESIFSQPAPIEDSQYIMDSFVVHETEPSRVHHDVSMCPLERAEKILKERRRAKRQYGQVGAIQSRKRRRIVRMGGSSDDD